MKSENEGIDMYMNDDTPFSCCDPAVHRPCIHAHVATDNVHYKYRYLADSTLFLIGCRQALMDYYYYSILKPYLYGLFFLVLVQVRRFNITVLSFSSLPDTVT